MSKELPSYCDHLRIPDRRSRFVDDVGNAFLLGLAGSSAFNLFRRGSFRAVAARAPRAAGYLAAYWAIASAVETGVAAARRKEDRWNEVAGGAAAWAAFGARRGAPGAAVLALCWGVEIMDGPIFDWLRDSEDKPTQPQPQPQRTRPVPAADGVFLDMLPPIEVKEVPAAGIGL